MSGIKAIERFPSGIVSPPASKSLGHRAAICAALAAGMGSESAPTGVDRGTVPLSTSIDRGTVPLSAPLSTIHGLSESDDIATTLASLPALGAGWRRLNDRVEIYTAQAPQPPQQPIDCGESGTTLRFLLPLLALRPTETVLTGRGRLLERPLAVYQRLFAEAGAELIHGNGFIKVRGVLRSGIYHLPGDISSQFVSGLLLALPLLAGDSELVLDSPLQSASYVALTRQVMARFGVSVEQPEPRRFVIPGGQRYQATDYQVEADYSQAAYFLAAAALGRPVRCRGLEADSVQGDRAFLDILGQMGARVTHTAGMVGVQAERLQSVTVDVGDIPDLVPPLATLCCFCEGTSHITNAARLRLKESDRLAALASELGKLGATIIEAADSLTITGPARLKGCQVDAWGDHRIAMSMALAAIRCDGTVSLSGWESVAKSYPDFWADFERSER